MYGHDVRALIAQDGHGTVATDLFLGDMPVSPAACVAVREYGGEEGASVFGVAGPAVEKPRVQVKVRGAVPYDYETPRRRIEAIYVDLSARDGAFTVNGTRYLALAPLQPPYPVGKDENNRWVFTVNFWIWKEPTTRVEVTGKDAGAVKGTE